MANSFYQINGLYWKSLPVITAGPSDQPGEKQVRWSQACLGKDCCVAVPRGKALWYCYYQSVAAKAQQEAPGDLIFIMAILVGSLPAKESVCKET